MSAVNVVGGDMEATGCSDDVFYGCRCVDGVADTNPFRICGQVVGHSSPGWAMKLYWWLSVQCCVVLGKGVTWE